MSIFVSRWNKQLNRISRRLFTDKKPITLFCKQCFLLTPIAVDNLLTLIANDQNLKNEKYKHIDKKLYNSSQRQIQELISFFLLDYIIEFRYKDEHLQLLKQIGYQQFEQFESEFLSLIEISKEHEVYKQFFSNQFSFSHTHYFLQMFGLVSDDAMKESLLLATEEIKKIFYNHFDQYLKKIIDFTVKHPNI